MTPDIRALLERAADLLDDVADGNDDCMSIVPEPGLPESCVHPHAATRIADLTRDIRDALTRPA